MSNIPNITDPKEAYEYSRQKGKRIPELEPVISQDSYWAYCYAVYVIKGRWYELEPAFKRYGWISYQYANRVIGDRWCEAEPFIMKNPGWAKRYLFDVLKHRNLNHL